MATKLDPKLLSKLANKVGKPEKYIREQVTKRASKNRVSSEAYFAHWLLNENIGSGKYRNSLSTAIQDQIRTLSQGTQSITNTSTKSQKIRRTEKVFKIPDIKLSAKPPTLSQAMILNSSKNAEVYPILFLLENTLRNIISSVLQKKHGKNWWNSKVHQDTKKKVNDRKTIEKLNPWTGQRGADPIFYTDFTDLSGILKRNESDFRPLLKGVNVKLDFITRRIDELAGVRNNIAHTSPLSKKDKDRLILYFTDLYDLLDTINGNI